MPSVLIVDDHAVVRQGLKEMLKRECRDVTFGEAGSAEEAVRSVHRRRWDLAVIDIGMRDGLEILSDIRGVDPELKILVLSVHAGPDVGKRVARLGARGYISEDVSPAELVKAFAAVLGGDTHFTRSAASASKAAQPRGAPLSRREKEVLAAIGAGQSGGEIAANLSVSAKTVSTYKHRMMKKFGVTSTAELIRHAISHGLI